MSTLLLSATAGEAENILGTIGGSPPLPVGTRWPRCRLCNSELIAFIDLRLPRVANVPFQAGSRLQIFACREHDDIAGTVYSDYSRFEAASRRRELPANYWELSDGHYAVRLVPPSVRTQAAGNEERLSRRYLAAGPLANEGADGFKLFGKPCWFQDPEDHVCACGAPMELLLQVPENYGFEMAEGAPAQPNSCSRTQYCLFLGNQLYLLACAKQCHPLALWPVLQN